MVIEFTALTGRRGNRGEEIFRGKSGLHRAACRVTPGERNLKESVTEKETAEKQLEMRNAQLKKSLRITHYALRIAVR